MKTICNLNVNAWWRPTDSPPSTLTDMQDKYCVDCYNIYSIQSHYKGNHKRGGPAEGRATSFVVATNGSHLCNGFE